jgi:hypothetical protein
MLAALERDEREDTYGEALLSPDLRGAERFVESADGARRPVDRDQREAWAARQVWPFRPTLALRPRADGERSVLSQRVRLPERSSLITAIGVHPRRWFKFPPSKVTFHVRVVDEAGRHEVMARTLDPHPNGADRGWFGIEIPLDRWGGRDVRIELVTEVERESSAVFEMGGFGWPYLVDRSGPVPLAGFDAPVSGSTP